ncbi:hypothetical protein K435DRAFT_798943 [Dendrothele bispora CBS 962.96]|uniref:Uncharacterized protein n=1 Tax=Dendrothele bispora (strain CBS 962.96) TaxID=1314807 RepID=A0A4V4HFC2_DENBC|nr:hypothetical protein K435DRAFT_798943 [Dendrothele bispora CBS 962.96]
MVAVAQVGVCSGVFFSPAVFLLLTSSSVEYPSSPSLLSHHDYWFWVTGINQSTPEVVPRLSQDCPRTTPGLSQDYPRTTPGLSQDYPRTVSGLPQECLRTTLRLPKDY